MVSIQIELAALQLSYTAKARRRDARSVTGRANRDTLVSSASSRDAQSFKI
jgi:hypothetical protein